MIASRIGRRRANRLSLPRGRLLGHRPRLAPPPGAPGPRLASTGDLPVPPAAIAAARGTMRDTTGVEVAPHVPRAHA